MERKLIRQGGGGYTIYLPKKWVDAAKLGKGSRLNINVSGNDLVMSPVKDEAHKKLETDIKIANLTESAIRTLITNAYRVGYDRIKVTFGNEKQFRILQDVVKTRLIGFDITKKQAESCFVENITEPSYDQFDNLLKKMFMNIEDIFRITAEKLSIEEREESLENIKEVEERIQKYDNFCRRVISKEKLIKKGSEMMWCFLSEIVHAQRELFHLNEAITTRIKVSDKTKELFKKNEEIFKILEKGYFEKNISEIGKIHDIEKEAIYKTAYSLIRNKSGKENLVVLHLAMSLKNFYFANSPLIGLIM
jgi:phosphate uptake regulator